MVHTYVHVYTYVYMHGLRGEGDARLAKHRVADRAGYMLQIQTGEQSVAESVALLKALSRGRRD